MSQRYRTENDINEIIERAKKRYSGQGLTESTRKKKLRNQLDKGIRADVANRADKD